MTADTPDDPDPLLDVLTAHQPVPPGRFRRQSYIECPCGWMGKTDEAHREHVVGLLWAGIENQAAEAVIEWAHAHCAWRVPDDDALEVHHALSVRSGQCACGWSPGDPSIGDGTIWFVDDE